MKYFPTIFYGFLLFIIASKVKAKPYDSILRFIQSHSDEDEDEYDKEEEQHEEDEEHDERETNFKDEEDHSDDKENEEKPSLNDQDNVVASTDKPLVEEPKKSPSWVDEEDLISEFESSQSERAKELSIKALQKRRAANSLRVYCEGIEQELEKAKKKTNGMKRLDKYKLTSQLESNLARAYLLYKQADLLDQKAQEANKSLELLHSNDKDSVILRDCNMLKIGPLSYSSRGDNVIHKTKEPLMAKLTGNSLVLYHNKMPKLTYYIVDLEMPTKPVESASRCFTFAYRGADQVFCSATEESAHTWMNAITEAWFCKNLGIKGTLISLKNIKSKKDEPVPLLKHAVKENKNKGLINMEVYVDDDKKTHLLVEGKEKPLSSISDIIDVNRIVKEKKENKNKKE
uniref:PH domain-containing protein n=1 Tax=Theileria annulata TaxID=5874 RepID=A0A3B0N044_THEAN